MGKLPGKALAGVSPIPVNHGRLPPLPWAKTIGAVAGSGQTRVPRRPNGSMMISVSVMARLPGAIRNSQGNSAASPN
jgi:hypothetical protein